MSSAAAASGVQSVAGFSEGAEGITPPRNPEGTGRFLSDVIADFGFVDRETVERAVEAAREPGRMVDRILLENGDLTEEELSRALAERYGLDHVDLGRFHVDMSAAGLVGRTAALRYRAIPIAFATDGVLIVAVADPVDALAINDLEVITKSETRRAVASGPSIDALAERLPEVEAPAPPSPSSDTDGLVDQELPGGSAADEGGVLTTSPEEEGQSVERPTEHAVTRNGGPDPGRVEAENRIAALEAELSKAHELVREETDRAEAETGRLREQLVELTQERDRLHKALDEVTGERDRLSAEAEQRSDDLRSVLEQLRHAEDAAEQGTSRIGELEDADRRAEAARLALRELREESEREREQSSRLESKLRDDLAAAEERNGALERRLAGLTRAASQAEAMAQELTALHRAIAGDDSRNGTDGRPQPRSPKPQPADASNLECAPDRRSSDVQKPTI
jgi:Type II secretion system (T2SS), protein E, N-terminal domain